MWTEGQGSEARGIDGRELSANRHGEAQPASCELNKIGIWVQGVDRLGAAYEGVWRVIKRFLLSSEGSGQQFCFVAPARFKEEIEEFLSDLPESLRKMVGFHPFGRDSDRHHDDEAVRQASHANQINVDAWLVPNPMWAAAKHLVKPKVVWFHDFLLAEFPQSYPRKLFVEFQENIRDLNDAGAFFIFLSPHVKNKHGHEVCGISPERSMLVVTPSLDVSKTLADLPDDPRQSGDFIRAELRENLQSWCTSAHAELFYQHISSYPFESVPYYFVSSQNREHKGFLRLAQIHAAMIRERYLPYSIFTTALVDVNGQSPLEKFLRAELLLGDFMSVGKVSELTHALLYKFARLTIHPSTFEGNLPLPFAESVSVGTPCIIPYSRAYLDLVDASMHPWIFYSPTEAGLRAKIQEVEQQLPEFLSAQQQILGTLRRYSLRDYFKLQMEAFKRAARVEPDNVVYFFEARDEEPTLRRKTLGDYLKLPSARSAAHGRDKKDQTVPSLQARFWPRFELSGVPENNTADSTALYSAQYLGSGFPKGESCFMLFLDRVRQSPELTELELFAEIGSWIDNEYQVADSRAFRFDELDTLPREVANFIEQAGVKATLGNASLIGWTKLTWSQGVVPEIRLGGKLFARKSAIKVRLAVFTNAGRQSPHRRAALAVQNSQ